MSPVLDEVRRIAGELFDVPVSQLNADSSPTNVENWDSVQHLNFILELEQKYDMRFDPEEIERMQSLGQIADIISGKVG